MAVVILTLALAPFILEQMANTRFIPNKRVEKWGNFISKILAF